jgi:hypothetical protein
MKVVIYEGYTNVNVQIYISEMYYVRLNAHIDITRLI